MSFINRHQLPRIVERGVETALSLDIYSASSVQQTATSATVTVKLGSRVLVEGASATTLGPPASYTLPASTLEDEDVSDQYLEVWTLVIGGETHTFRRAGHLVRHAFHPTITDTDLTDRDSDLLNIVPDSETNLSQYREAARKRLERDLLRKGRRPWLIFDSYELTDAHIALSLHLFYRDQHIAIGDGRYKEAADEYGAEYREALSEVNFRYDDNETGNVDTETRQSATSVLRITSSPRTYRRWRR
jgi:hypothetical protein